MESQLPVLAGKGLFYRFGETEALRGASLEVRRGEVVAVTGPSGCGKSTLLHCLAGILVPNSGTIEFDGASVGKLSDGARTRLRRRRFGFVFQFGDLVSELTIAENVALPLRLAGVRRQQARGQAEELLTRLQILDVAHRLPGQASGGQVQRAALARALIHSPAVIFADEPTGALDTAAGEAVMELIIETAGTSGSAVVMVSHDPRVATYADREVAMRDGATEFAAASL